MTISSLTNRNDYVGTGSLNTYSYTFKIFVNTHLAVSVVNLSGVQTDLALTTDYTVTGVGETAGGTIVLVNSGQPWLTGGNLTSGFGLAIRRVLPLTQETDIRNQGDFFPEVHENQFDRDIMIAQQLQAELDRNIKLPESESPTDDSTIIPAISVRSERFFKWDSSGDIAVSTIDFDSLPSANVFVGNGSGNPVARAISGDVTISNTGVVTVSNGLALTKLAPLSANILPRSDGSGFLSDSTWSWATNNLVTGAQNALRFTAGNSNYVSFVAPASITSSYGITWPTAQGAADTYLHNDGSGVMTWVPLTGGPGGTVSAGLSGRFSYYPANGNTVNDQAILSLSATTIVIAGGSNLAMSGSAQIFGPVGSVSSPGYSFDGDPDTGLIDAAADAIGIVTAGAERVRIDPTGLVGIGTTSPSSYNANASNLVISSTGTTGITIQGVANGNNNIGFSDAVGTGLPGLISYAHNATGANERMAFRVNLVDNVLSLSPVGTGQALLTAGSASAPSLAFQGDDDLGLYLNGAGFLGFVTGGVHRGQFRDTALELSVPIHPNSGSAAAPTHSFSTDPDTGWYRTSANAMGWTTGGVIKWDFNQDGTMRSQNSSYGINCGFGTAALPGYSFTGDEDTGMYRTASANNIGFAANGVNSLTISDSAMISNVRIYAPDGTQGSPAIAFNNDTDNGIYRIGADQWGLVAGGNLAIRTTGSTIALYTSNTERWNVVSSGNLIPVSDNAYSLGQSGSRTSSVWSANGTIQTSHSSTKQGIVDVDASEIELPRGVFYNRDGRRWLGYLNDTLPSEGRPFDENGNICEKDNYEQAMIGILCAHVRKLESEITKLKMGVN